MQLTVAQIAGAIEGRLLVGPSGAVVTSYHTDSRLVLPGGAFFALRGAEADGHAYLAEAVGHGAAVVVVERGDAVPEGATAIEVADSWTALFALARSVLDAVDPEVVGITGSNGKTSTKDLLTAALAGRYRVHRTEGNLNTETGLPLTLLGLEPAHEVAVLEMGMQGPGEIARLCALARPRIGVVTSIGSVHAEFFPDGKDGIARAKGELLAALPEDGLGVVNADDAYAPRLAARSAAPVCGYGFERSFGPGGLRGTGFRILPDGGTAFAVEGTAVRLLAEGRHLARNALGALAVARRLGVPIPEGAARIAEVRTEHRLQRRAAPGGWMIVDDAYNASPESMRAAFETVTAMARRGRLLAVLGQMAELGDEAPAAHVELGREAGALFDELCVVEGGWGATFAAAAGAEMVPDRAAAAGWVRAHVQPGDLLLVKASHGLALDRLVADLLARA
ncbi:MAG: UDP-N-acetylmuramoyl-tripeptide--D-alanyl-D-alanine ligase [Candidatus Dormiibacterota bacterium]